MFGGERFQDWIGTISIGEFSGLVLVLIGADEKEIGKDMKDALEQEQEQQTEMAQVCRDPFVIPHSG
jgi:hypothetical protein